MQKNIILTSEAPAPIGPYSQAVLVGGTLYISGQIALKNGEMQNNSIETEAEQVMLNLAAILAAADMSFANVAKCTIFLKDMNDFQTVNAIYGRYFPTEPPARETVEVSRLPKDARVEISCIAIA